MILLPREGKGFSFGQIFLTISLAGSLPEALPRGPAAKDRVRSRGERAAYRVAGRAQVLAKGKEGLRQTPGASGGTGGCPGRRRI